MNQRFHSFCSFDIGRIGIVEEGGKIIRIFFSPEESPGDLGERKATPLLESAANQLDDYFAGRRTAFDLALDPHGTDFQKIVWCELTRIPYGQTATYGEIAERAAKKIAKNKNGRGYARAVGQANNKNPICIVIPCHRVIGAQNKLVGYAAGLDKKIFLLNLECPVPELLKNAVF